MQKVLGGAGMKRTLTGGLCSHRKRITLVFETGRKAGRPKECDTNKLRRGEDVKCC